MKITGGSSHEVAARAPIVSLGILFLFLLVPAQGLAFPDTIGKGPAGQSHVETYRYEAVAAGEEKDKEEIELAFSFEEDSAEYASTIVSVKSDDGITIRMTKEGNLISGTRCLLRSLEGPVEEKIWRDGRTAYVEHTPRAA